MNAGHAMARMNRGLAFRAKGEIERAKADFTATLELPSEDKEAQDAQATARDQLAALEEVQQDAHAPERSRLPLSTRLPRQPASELLWSSAIRRGT